MTTDLFAFAFLLLAGASGVVAFARTGRPHFAAGGAMLLFLAADERVEVHERAGEWIDGRGLKPPGLQHSDTLVLALYAAVFGALLLRYWRPLTAPAFARGSFVAAMALSFAAIAMDALVPNEARFQHSEEYFEVAAAAALALGFSWHAVSPVLPPGGRGELASSGAGGDSTRPGGFVDLPRPPDDR